MIAVDRAAALIVSVVSRRKAAHSAAASSERKGGQRRVFERPAWGAFAITPIAQVKRLDKDIFRSIGCGSIPSSSRGSESRLPRLHKTPDFSCRFDLRPTPIAIVAPTYNTTCM